MRCLPSAQARARLKRATDDAAHIARITPIDAIDGGKMLLTLMALEIGGENMAAARMAGIAAGSPETPEQKKSRLRAAREGQQGGVKQSGQEPLDIQTNWMVRFILWNH